MRPPLLRPPGPTMIYPAQKRRRAAVAVAGELFTVDDLHDPEGFRRAVARQRHECGRRDRVAYEAANAAFRVTVGRDRYSSYESFKAARTRAAARERSRVA